MSTRCRCNKPGDEKKDDFIQCEQCMSWQHFRCNRIDKNNVPEKYLCERCDPSGHADGRYATMLTSKQPKPAKKPTKKPRKKKDLLDDYISQYTAVHSSPIKKPRRTMNSLAAEQIWIPDYDMLETIETKIQKAETELSALKHESEESDNGEEKLVEKVKQETRQRPKPSPKPSQKSVPKQKRVVTEESVPSTTSKIIRQSPARKYRGRGRGRAKTCLQRETSQHEGPSTLSSSDSDFCSTQTIRSPRESQIPPWQLMFETWHRLMGRVAACEWAERLTCTSETTDSSVTPPSSAPASPSKNDNDESQVPIFEAPLIPFDPSTSTIQELRAWLLNSLNEWRDEYLPDSAFLPETLAHMTSPYETGRWWVNESLVDGLFE